MHIISYLYETLNLLRGGGLITEVLQLSDVDITLNHGFVRWCVN